MFLIGMDMHKKFSRVEVMDEAGQAGSSGENRISYLPEAYIPSRDVRDNRELLRYGFLLSESEPA